MLLKQPRSAPARFRHGRPRHVRACPHALAAPPNRHHIRAGGRRTGLLARLALSSKSLAKAHYRLATRRIHEWTFYDVDRRRVPASHARSSVTHDSHDEAPSADDGCCSLDLSGGAHFSFDVRFTEALHYGRSSSEELASAMARTPSCAFCVVLASGYGCGDRLASSRALSTGHAVLLGKGHRGSVLLVRCAFGKAAYCPAGAAWFRSSNPGPPSNASRQWPRQRIGRDQRRPVVIGELP
jgi:hypothetical protein